MPRAGAVVAALALLVGALGTGVGGCGLAPSNVVAKKDRAVVDTPEAVRWGPATRADVIGHFESDAISGDAAASLRKIEYVFAADGSYSGSALVQEAKGETFQTLAGRWTFANGSLRLGDDPPAKTDAAPGRLRLASEGGTVAFRRVTAR